MRTYLSSPIPAGVPRTRFYGISFRMEVFCGAKDSPCSNLSQKRPVSGAHRLLWSTLKVNLVKTWLLSLSIGFSPFDGMEPKYVRIFLSKPDSIIFGLSKLALKYLSRKNVPSETREDYASFLRVSIA